MADVLNAKIVAAETIAKECDELAADLTALKVAYEQFFLGMERRPPHQEHQAIKKRLTKLKSSYVRQTAAKFRLGTLATTLSSYERMWERTIQEMENGTYRRDLFKARLHTKARAAEPKPQPNEAQANELAKAAAKAPVAPASTGEGGLSDAKLRSIYDAYLMAKRRCNEDVSRLSYESVAGALKKQVPELLKQHNAKAVDFKVVIKDGKAILRAVPK
ncbi:MAG: hypothetical protein HYZ28_20310 [Myxococcales bacterium]|nr:hypothetical protein [Myxococcales bacterium]